MSERPPLPPFDAQSAATKVQAAEPERRIFGPRPEAERGVEIPLQ
jgi:nuclear transport factor 2 (NTF2) superfamily protein